MGALVDRDGMAAGACYALAHAASVLDDAAALYSLKRASGAFYLAVMAREELGRFNLLATKIGEIPADGTIDAKELAAYIRLHKNKLLAGQSIVPVPMTPEQLAEWTEAIARNDSTAASRISEDIRARAQKLKPHQVGSLHKRRLKAQYVDLDTNTGAWSKPSSITLPEASSLIRTVLAEISNSLIRAQGVAWVHSAIAATGSTLPQMGTFSHRVFARLGEGDA